MNRRELIGGVAAVAASGSALAGVTGVISSRVVSGQVAPGLPRIMPAPLTTIADVSEAEMLTRYRQASPAKQKAFVRALARVLDGWDVHDVGVQFYVECGHTPAEARRLAIAAVHGTGGVS